MISASVTTNGGEYVRPCRSSTLPTQRTALVAISRWSMMATASAPEAHTALTTACTSDWWMTTSSGPAPMAPPALGEPPPAPPLPGNCRVCETWLLASAYEQIGIRYRLGGTRPDTGFDCSGLVRYLYERNFQVSLPQTAPQQFQYGLRVEKWELEPGDLVFFRTRRGWHVGMYVGDDSFIHAPNRRKTVRVSPLFSDPYWRRAYVGARRVLVPEQPMMLAAEEAASNSNNNN